MIIRQDTMSDPVDSPVADAGAGADAGAAAVAPAEERPGLAIRTMSTPEFDIIKTYNDILAADPDLTKPVAAINALIALLNTVKTSTVMETMATLREHSKTLRRSVKNPVPLFAGIDLFTQVLIKSFEGQGPDFEATKEHLLRNGRLFAQRAVDARNGMAERGQELVREGKTVLTHGASRSVTTLLARAARERAGKFKVIYVREEARAEESDRVVAELRSHGIPTAEIDPSSVAHVLSLGKEVHMVFVGAEAVTNSGGIISRMGTLGIAQAAATARIPLYVAVESHKFVRRFVMDQKDLGFEQDALDFSVEKPSERLKDAVDYTSLITENGIVQTSHVLELLLDFYGSLRSDEDTLDD